MEDKGATVWGWLSAWEGEEGEEESTGVEEREEDVVVEEVEEEEGDVLKEESGGSGYKKIGEGKGEEMEEPEMWWKEKYVS